MRHNGNSAIENVKRERLYDVLVFASEKKEMDELISKHYENQTNGRG